MQALDFAVKLASPQNDPSLVRWSERLIEIVARETLYLARRIGSIPEDLQPGYWAAVVELMNSIPDDVQVEVSRTLWDAVEESAPSSLKASLRQKMRLVASPELT